MKNLMQTYNQIIHTAIPFFGYFLIKKPPVVPGGCNKYMRVTVSWAILPGVCTCGVNGFLSCKT
jgi:hypothetical protein